MDAGHTAPPIHFYPPPAVPTTPLAQADTQTNQHYPAMPDVSDRGQTIGLEMYPV